MTSLLASRTLRWVTLGFACVSAIALFLLATATANTDFFAGHYNTLLVITGALVVLLMLVVGGQLLQRRRGLKWGGVGSRTEGRWVRRAGGGTTWGSERMRSASSRLAGSGSAW